MAKQFRIRSVLAACALASLVWMAGGCLEARAGQRDVTVEIVDARGTVFQQVAVKKPLLGEGETRRAYLEAERDARYRIRIRNPTGRRVGVVIAVDGRNIISGAKSELERDEPMYILDAWSTQEFSGWRANLSEVNEFYFTEWKDSYAEAFGDRSARGVIAVAVYREKAPPRRLWSEESPRQRAQSEAAPASAAADASAPPAVGAASGAGAAREAQSARKAERADEAGTGYGDLRSEYATQVEFNAESRVSQQIFLKYEWRENLCRQGILTCADDPPNRFWPERSYGFAPPPPAR